MGVTSDPKDPRLTRGADPVDGPPVDQAEVYLVLSDEERTGGFVRPVRQSYWHTTCGQVTSMGRTIAETFARSPAFYGSTYCATCKLHRPVGTDGEFHWCSTPEEMQAPERAAKVGT